MSGRVGQKCPYNTTYNTTLINAMIFLKKSRIIISFNCSAL